MGETVDINGHPTWIDQHGSGNESILILHGGLSNSDALEALTHTLAERYRVVAFDRRGHGRTADTEEAFHYEDMVTEAIGVIEHVVGGPAYLIGWSDGGIIALLLAIRRPELIDRMVLIGANFHYEGVLPIDVDPQIFDGMRQSYAERSPDGEAHFDTHIGKAMTMMASEPALTPAHLRAIEAPALVMDGDADLIRLGQTCELYESLAASQLAIVPGPSHVLPLERPDETARIILDFLEADVPPATLMPVRRAAR